jgi:hypothetical protein
MHNRALEGTFLCLLFIFFFFSVVTALQAEINEKHEKNIGEDAYLLEIGVEPVIPGPPDMQFEFSDSDLHEDLYQVIKYSCDEMFSDEQSRQFLHLWTFFLEHFLGVANEHHKSEVTQAQVNRKSEGLKACIVRVGESSGSGAVADKSSKTASPGTTDVARVISGAQKRGNDQAIFFVHGCLFIYIEFSGENRSMHFFNYFVYWCALSLLAGVTGSLCKSGVTVEAVAQHLSGSKTSAAAQVRTHMCTR